MAQVAEPALQQRMMQPGGDPYAYATRDFPTTHSRDTLSTLDVQLSSPSVQSSWPRRAAHAPLRRPPPPTPLPKPGSTAVPAGQPRAAQKLAVPLQFGTHAPAPKPQQRPQQSELSSEDASTVLLTQDSTSQQTSGNSRGRAAEEASSLDSALTAVHASSASQLPPQLGTGVHVLMRPQQPAVHPAAAQQNVEVSQQRVRQAGTAVAKATPQPPGEHPHPMSWRSRQLQQEANPPQQPRPQPQHFKRAQGSWHSGKQAHIPAPAKTPVLVTPPAADHRTIAAAANGSPQSGVLPDVSQLPGAVPSKQGSVGQQWVVQQKVAQGVAECRAQPVPKRAPVAKAMCTPDTAAPTGQPAKPLQPTKQPKAAQAAKTPSTEGLQGAQQQPTAAIAEAQTGQRKLRGNATQRRKARQEQQPAADEGTPSEVAEGGSVPPVQGESVHAEPATKKASVKGGRAAGGKVWVPKLPAAVQAAPAPAVVSSPEGSSEQREAPSESEKTKPCKTPRPVPDLGGDKPQDPGIGAWRPEDAVPETPGTQGPDSSPAPLRILKPVKVTVAPAAASEEAVQDAAAAGGSSTPNKSLLSEHKAVSSSPTAAAAGQYHLAEATAAVTAPHALRISSTGDAVWIRAGTAQGPLYHGRLPIPAQGARTVFWMHMQQARAMQGRLVAPGTPLETGTPLGSCSSLDQSFTDAGTDCRWLRCFLERPQLLRL